ncbi:MAG: flagellar brake protein [Proteobacteria bacterium]|nr:flagellar brake protein [Pseudomonadota bacterium]
MSEDNKQTIINDNDSGQYLITSPLEIANLLRLISEKRQWVTAYFNHGADFLLTSIIRVHTPRREVFLDYGGSNINNRKITEAGRVIFVTAHDRVKIQFSSDRVTSGTVNSLPALRIGLPDSLIKLQRRENYRVNIPLMQPLTGELFLKSGEMLKINIHDISAGGICMTVGAEHRFALNEEISQCRIYLPDEGTIETMLKIRHIAESAIKGNLQEIRYGCMFVDIELDDQTRIQRYISDIEREVRARSRR